MTISFGLYISYLFAVKIHREVRKEKNEEEKGDVFKILFDSIFFTHNQPLIQYLTSDRLRVWNDHTNIVGGRDRVRGGTWLAVCRQSSRFAILTNIR